MSFDDEIYTFEYDSEVSSKAKLIVKNTQDNTESPSEVDDSKFILFADEDFIPVDYTGKTWAQALKSRLEYEGDMIYTAEKQVKNKFYIYDYTFVEFFINVEINNRDDAHLILKSVSCLNEPEFSEFHYFNTSNYKLIPDQDFGVFINGYNRYKFELESTAPGFDASKQLGTLDECIIELKVPYEQSELIRHNFKFPYYSY